MEPSVIFGSLKLARSIAEFAGLIETIGTKIDRLANAEFEAGFRALEQAAISSSEKDSLLRESRYRFNKAISFEKEERLFLCHVGLAICHKELGDHPNFKISLLQASEVQIHSAIEEVANSLSSKVKSNKVASIVAIGLFLYPPITAGVLYTTSELEKIKSRRSGLESQKKKIKGYLSNIGI
ncbi:hypothetical protein [Pseudanabaena mucicola]|uniref:Uncharacterized protein n=1 Tax=Pseudanabaena mucicola FACHB-723 TaxID=2692860 RepID=A0ABR7ZW67_9CYAN|nr:hypothetical protein [Pseudanabaena mucicola]MBD2188062.1 hypothetical protein [Pseudanabaena mucicola FACHB-723]